MIWDNFSIFRTNCAITCRTRAYMLRGFLYILRRRNGVRNSRNRFMLFSLAHNSTSLWQLELCLIIFVVSCSSSSEDSAEFRYVPLYIADQVVFHYFFFFFYKNFTLLHSKFHICKRLTPFHNTAKS